MRPLRNINILPIIILALGLSLTPKLFATSEEILAGHEGWLDRMGGGIHELGMGNTGSAMEEAMPGAYWNPALLPFSKKTMVGAGGEYRSLDRDGGFIGIQTLAASNLGIGLGVLERGDLGVKAYDENENSIGTARPQYLGYYLGLGFKTSRSNSFGITLPWFSSTIDVGNGVGNINEIGMFNLGWYRRWTESWRSAMVIRNLGINSRLSANYAVTVDKGEQAGSFGQNSNEDFFPKTLVLAVSHKENWFSKNWDLNFELLDFMLKDQFLVTDQNFHVWDFRLGMNCQVYENFAPRIGYDRGNLSTGFTYATAIGKHPIYLDYALVMEQGLLTINPYQIGLRSAF